MLNKKDFFDRVGGADAPGLALKRTTIIGNQIIYDDSPFETLRTSFCAFANAADIVSLLGDNLSYHQQRRLSEISKQLFAIYKELNKWEISKKESDLFNFGLEN